MAGELQLGGTTLATHTGSGASAKINLDSGLVFPAGHVLYRILQTEVQPNNQTGNTANEVATTLSVTPLSNTSKFLFRCFGCCGNGSTSVGLGGNVIITPTYSLNSDMSLATSGNPAKCSYFNTDSPSSNQDITDVTNTFYSSTIFSHNGNTYYFNCNLNLYNGYRAYFRPITFEIMEVF